MMLRCEINVDRLIFIVDNRRSAFQAKTVAALIHSQVIPAFSLGAYFLQHRNETRGVGGLFFDDVNEHGFERSFEFLRSAGDSFFSLTTREFPLS